MNTFFKVLFLTFFTLHFCVSSRAYVLTQHRTLLESIDSADFIAVAEVDSFVGDAKQQAELKKEMTEKRVYRDNEALAFFQRLRPRVVYKFRSVKDIKGKVESTFKVYTYRVQSNANTKVLLLLKRDESGELQMVDNAPPIVLGTFDEAGTQMTIDNVSAPSQSVLKLIVASLTDPTLRARNTGLLRDVVDQSMVAALAPFIKDTNVEVRNNVLYNMTLNQQVAAIPRIVNEVRQDKNGYGGASPGALQRLNVPEAVPYLNPLLFESNQHLRYNVIQTLRNLVDNAYNKRNPLDRSSIPYFVLALRDPAPNQNVSMSAFASLYRYISANGVVDYDAFRTKPRAETQKLLNWWRDELSGKHPRELMPGETLVVKNIPANLNRLTREQAVAALNPLLWEMSSQTRRMALAQLQKRANRSSIPYLLLACEDPDFDVAYGAYQLLGTLLPKVGAPVIRKSFEVDRDAALKPFYAWWQDELLDKHSTEGLKRFEQEQQMQREMEKRRATMQTPTKTSSPKTNLQPPKTP